MASSVTLWLDPLNPQCEADRIFDRNDPRNGDQIFEPYVHLRERLARYGVEVHTGDLLEDGRIAPAKTNLYATMSLRRHEHVSRRSDTVLSAFFVNESPVVEPRLFAELEEVAGSFRRLYSYAPDEAMGEFLGRTLPFRSFRFPYPFDSVDESAWSNRDRSFLTMIAMNKVPRLDHEELYSERLRAVEHFGRTSEIDLYGIGWDGPSFRVGETRVPRPLRNLGFRLERRWDRLRPGRKPLLQAARRVYRGPVASTGDTLARYTFSICFENMVLDGWVTEKIFNNLRAGTIPVYLGAPDIERWVWPECFVDMRRFSGYEELREYLLGLSSAEVDTYREAGREYFASPDFHPFTKDAFARIFEEIVREDAGITL
jgi:hypothetical protein